MHAIRLTARASARTALEAQLAALQDRELTPEDYELLLRLDESVKPKYVAFFIIMLHCMLHYMSVPRICRHYAVVMCMCHGGCVYVYISVSRLFLPFRTVAKAMLSAFTTHVVTAATAGATCTVCQCELDAGDEAMQLPCGHTFHAPCITRWLADCADRCPVDGLTLG